MSIESLRRALQVRPASLTQQLPISFAIGLALPAAVLGVVLMGMDLHLLGLLAWTAATVMIAFALDWFFAAVVIAILMLGGVLLWHYSLAGVTVLGRAEQAALVLVTALSTVVGRLIARELRQRESIEAAGFQLDVFANTIESIFSASHDCIKLLAADGAILSINARGLQLINAESAGQVVGQSWFSFWGSEQQNTLTAAWNKALTDGQADFNGNCRILTGERRTWCNTFTRVRTPSQNQTYIICISSDVTDNINLQQSLKGSAAQLNGLLNSIDDASFSLDSHWIISSTNQHGEELCAQIGQATAVGRSLWEVFPLKQSDPAAIFIRRAMAEQALQRCEYFYAPQQLWFSITAFPFAPGINIFVRDITSLKESQKLAAEEAARLRVAQDIAGFGDWSFDYDQGAMYFSPRAVAVLELENCERQEYKKCLLEKLNPHDRMELVQAIINCTEAAPNIDLIVRMPTQDGAEKHLHWIGRLVADERGNAASLLGAIQDVSEHLQVQQKIEKAHYFVRDLVDALPQRIIVIDKEGHYVITNQTWNRVRQNFYGNTDIAENFFETSDFSASDRAIAEATHKGARDIFSGAIERFEYEYEIVINGQSHQVLLQILPLKSADESLAVLVYNDITRAK